MANGLIRWILSLAILGAGAVAAADSPAPGLREPRAYAQTLERVAPIYPNVARRQQIEGRVVAWVYVDADGKVTRVRIRRSPHELLSDAVEAAVAKWKFMGAVKDGKPASSIAEYEFVFNLTDPDVELKSEVASPDAATVSRYVGSREGAEVFRTGYWKAQGHKAFASAESGSWGWAGERSSTEQAVQAALEVCERGRDRLTSACRIVNIDGQWQASTERTNTKLRNLSPFEIAYFGRDAIENWPDEKKRKALSLLDECRAEGESFVQTFRLQDADAMWAAVAQELRDTTTRQEFDLALSAMRKLAGAAAHVTFKEQRLATRLGDEELRLDLETVSIYSVTGSTGTPLALLVGLSRESGKCRVTAFQYLGSALPQWLQEQQSNRGT